MLIKPSVLYYTIKVYYNTDNFIRTTRCPLWLVYRKFLVDFLCMEARKTSPYIPITQRTVWWSQCISIVCWYNTIYFFIKTKKHSLLNVLLVYIFRNLYIILIVCIYFKILYRVFFERRIKINGTSKIILKTESVQFNNIIVKVHFFLLFTYLIVVVSLCRRYIHCDYIN